MTPAAPPGGIVARTIALCARHRALTLLAVAAATFWGVQALRTAPLDAIPDLGDVQVIVTAQWPGRSPDLVESQITYPISSRLLSAPGVSYVRGQSDFGVSFVYVVFEEGPCLRGICGGISSMVMSSRMSSKVSASFQT